MRQTPFRIHKPQMHVLILEAFVWYCVCFPRRNGANCHTWCRHCQYRHYIGPRFACTSSNTRMQKAIIAGILLLVHITPKRKQWQRWMLTRPLRCDEHEWQTHAVTVNWLGKQHHCVKSKKVAQKRCSQFCLKLYPGFTIPAVNVLCCSALSLSLSHTQHTQKQMGYWMVQRFYCTCVSLCVSNYNICFLTYNVTFFKHLWCRADSGFYCCTVQQEN